MIQVDELFATPSRRRRDVLRLSTGEGLETAIGIAKAGEPVIFLTPEGAHELYPAYQGFTTAKGIPLYVSHMLQLPLGGAAEIVDALDKMLGEFAGQHVNKRRTLTLLVMLASP
jgi:hypothetical protein